MESKSNIFKIYDEFQLFVLNPIDTDFEEFLKKIKIKCKNSIKIIRKANISKKNKDIDYILVKNNLKGLKAILWYLKERGEFSEIKGVKRLKMYDIPKEFRNFVNESDSNSIDQFLRELIK